MTTAEQIALVTECTATVQRLQAELNAAVQSLDEALAIVPVDHPLPPTITVDAGLIYFSAAPEGYELETLLPDHSSAGGWMNGNAVNPTPDTGGTVKARLVQRGPGGEYTWEGDFAELTTPAQ